MVDSAHYVASLLGVHGKHPYLTMSGYPVNVLVLKYWYLVCLTKVLWALDETRPTQLEKESRNGTVM